MYRDKCNNAHVVKCLVIILIKCIFNYTQVSSLETNVAQIGEKLASLIDIVSAKSDKDKGGKSKIKEVLPLVSITNLVTSMHYGYKSLHSPVHNLGILIIVQETMHDIFDVEFAAEIEEEVAVKVWSELPQELVQKMVESAVNHIEIAELDPPPRKAIVKRLREFYSNRRSLALVKDNPDKRRSRRAALKCSSTLYVS